MLGTPLIKTASASQHLTPTDKSTSAKPARWWLAALLTLALVGVARLAYLVWWCPYDLAPDEAYYWAWSRQLDWCYFSKGPLVAWLIRAGDLLGGGLRDQHGSAMPAVRLPAVVCGQLLALGSFCLTWQASGSPVLGYFTLLALLMTPHITALSTLITIDSPFLCCWQWALVIAWRVLGLTAATENGQTHRLRDSWFSIRKPAGSLADWLILGGIVGIGILAKPTMVLFPVCLAILLAIELWIGRLGTADMDRKLIGKGFALMLVVSGLVGGGPIVWWNAQHDWVTFRHVFRQASFHGPAQWRLWGWLEYFGVQTALLFGGGMVAWIAATWSLSLARSQQWETTRPAVRFLLAFSWPVFAVFAGFSLRTAILPNWPVAAYLSAVPLVAIWLRQTWYQTDWLSRALRWLGIGSGLAALAVTILLHRPEIAYQTGLLPSLARLTGFADHPLWPRRFDPTCRLQGWRELAQIVEGIRQACREQGQEPVLAATSYGTAAELAFYLPDQPQVYSLNLVNDGRLSQYDMWQPNPTANPELFAGKLFICVGPLARQTQAGFVSVQLLPTVVIKRHGYEIAWEWIHLGQGFRGFPAREKPPSY